METKELLVGNKKHMIMSTMGPELYQKVYEFLKFNRRKGTDEALIHAKIKDMVGGNKNLMS